MKFVTQELYGGAITTKLPTGLIDASNLRQIPDTQEVFLNSSENSSDFSQLFKDDSIIIELLERVEGTDEESVQSHLAELSNLNSVGANEWALLNLKKLQLANFEDDSAYVATCIEPSKKWGRPDGNTSLVIVLGIIRIAKVETDLLVTVNSPVTQAQFGEDLIKLEKGQLSEESDLRKKIQLVESVVEESLKSLEIKDWGLFP